MPMHLFNNKIIITDDGGLRSYNSIWYHCFYVGPERLRVAGGPVETTPDGNTLGGWQIDAETEYLYGFAQVCADWDQSSNPDLCIDFEVNTDNTLGNVTDTVDLSVTAWYKGDGDTACKTQVAETATTVGQSARYKKFTCIHTFDREEAGNIIDIYDNFAFRVNLETDTSEVDNIIINFMCFRYKSTQARTEVP